LLPPSLTHLTFGFDFNLVVNHWPQNVTHLTFGYTFNLPVKKLPKSLIHLIFGKQFNQAFNDPPPALQLLHFGRDFKQSIENLPNTLQTLLTFTSGPITLPPCLSTLHHCSITNNLNGPLPHTIKTLTISGGNDSIDFSTLSLTHLKLLDTATFSPPLDRLPGTLQNLNICGNWNGPLTSLPPNLSDLRINSTDFDHPLDQLPSSINHFILGRKCTKFLHSLDSIPSSITHLDILVDIEQPIQFKKHPHLTHLTLGKKFNQPIDSLPHSITHLTFGHKFNRPVNYLPPNITRLKFGNSFNQSVNSLPPKITHLSFGYDFNKPVNNLPPSLTHLTFGYSFDQPVDSLPHKITRLSFGFSFNHPVLSLPQFLTHLAFGVMFDKPIYNLPSTLSSLSIAVFHKAAVRSIYRILHLPHKLAYLGITLIQDFGQNNGKVRNFDEFSKDAVEKGDTTEDYYALRIALVFYVKKISMVWLTEKGFMNRFVAEWEYY
jgi:hypothetical protein